MLYSYFEKYLLIANILENRKVLLGMFYKYK